MPVRLALISGPAYDPLYERLRESPVPVEVGFRGDHPSLNRHFASFDAELPYDLVSTHTKYAPSQERHLAALDDLLSPALWSDFAPRVLTMASVSGRKLGVPRNLDVRLLHYRTDLTSAPDTWDELFEICRHLQSTGRVRSAFVFPGMESGLFGTFYELCEMAGAELFPSDARRPRIESDAGAWALGFLRKSVDEGLAPRAAKGWHYDAVHAYFRAGHAAFVGDWPGYYAFYRDPNACPVAAQIAVSAYPKGPAGKSLAYAGAHTFALTRAGAVRPEAVQVLELLTAVEPQTFEAERGFVPVRRSVLSTLQAHSHGAELARFRTLEAVTRDAMLIPPQLPCYPEIEATIWQHVQAAVFDGADPDRTLREIATHIEHILQRGF